MIRRPAVLALVVLAAGCGSGAARVHEGGSKAADARFAAGLRHWGAGMNGAIAGLTELFSKPASVQGIAAGDRRTSAVLAGYQDTLASCSERVRHLGAPPPSLVVARREALEACVNLERAAGLVRRGVAQFRGGRGNTILNASGDPLALGQDAVRRAQLALETPP